MSKQKNRVGKKRADVSNRVSQATADHGWSKAKTGIVSLGIIGFLFVLIMWLVGGPASHSQQEEKKDKSA